MNDRERTTAHDRQYRLQPVPGPRHAGVADFILTPDPPPRHLPPDACTVRIRSGRAAGWPA